MRWIALPRFLYVAIKIASFNAFATYYYQPVGDSRVVAAVTIGNGLTVPRNGVSGLATGDRLFVAFDIAMMILAAGFGFAARKTASVTTAKPPRPCHQGRTGHRMTHILSIAPRIVGFACLRATMVQHQTDVIGRKLDAATSSAMGAPPSCWRHWRSIWSGWAWAMAPLPSVSI